MKILLKVKFIGSAYQGFQCQKSGKAVQNVLTAAAEKVFGFPCNVTGSSRTDAGVHALGFCVSVEPKEGIFENWCTIPIGKIHRAFSARLPDDIAVVAAASAEDDFHPRYSCRGKNYIYRIWDAPNEDPFEKGRSARCAFKITDEKLAIMQEGAKCFVGCHDFRAFMAQGSKIVDTVRTVAYSDVYRDRSGAVIFSVSADGFLYNMVRIMAGTLLDAASGRIGSVEKIAEIIESKERSKAGHTAPACGLYLNEVFYEEEINWQCE